MLQRQQLLVFNTICILCICVFCVYQIQETALNTIDDVRRQIVKRPPILSTFQIHKADSEFEEDDEDADADADEANGSIGDLTAVAAAEGEVRLPPVSTSTTVASKAKPVDEGPPIWVTMAVCYGENSHYHGKDHFPYVESMPLSTQLWLKTTTAKVILQIVYNQTEPSEKLLKYKAELEGYGAVVKMVPAGNMNCVLKAQIIRVLAYLLPDVPKNAVIVTADVDAFVMTPRILLPIKKLPDKKIWVFRYAFTHTAGSTFNMPFIGAYSQTWRDILIYDPSEDDPENGILGNGIPKMIDLYRTFMNFSESYTWDIDQHIVSYAIMKNRLCTLPKGNNLWKILHVEPKEFDDQATCWHGDGTYEDCNNVLWTRNIMIRYKGGTCKWWHFFPTEEYPAVRSKFQEILANGDYEDGILNALLKSAKKVQVEAFGQVVV